MRIFYKVLLFLAIAIFLVFLFFHFTGNTLAPVAVKNLQNQICIGQNCFFAEIADTEVLRERGLMYRKELDKDRATFFIFDEDGVYPFWMKNTLIPLDMIWISLDKKIVFISSDVQPCKIAVCPVINPLVKAHYVLEINGGLSRELGFKIGDVVDVKAWDIQ